MTRKRVNSAQSKASVTASTGAQSVRGRGVRGRPPAQRRGPPEEKVAESPREAKPEARRGRNLEVDKRESSQTPKRATGKPKQSTNPTKDVPGKEDSSLRSASRGRKVKETQKKKDGEDSETPTTSQKTPLKKREETQRKQKEVVIVSDEDEEEMTPRNHQSGRIRRASERSSTPESEMMALIEKVTSGRFGPRQGGDRAEQNDTPNQEEPEVVEIEPPKIPQKRRKLPPKRDGTAIGTRRHKMTRTIELTSCVRPVAYRMRPVTIAEQNKRNQKRTRVTRQMSAHQVAQFQEPRDKDAPVPSCSVAETVEDFLTASKADLAQSSSVYDECVAVGVEYDDMSKMFHFGRTEKKHSCRQKRLRFQMGWWRKYNKKHKQARRKVLRREHQDVYRSSDDEHLYACHWDFSMRRSAPLNLIHKPLTNLTMSRRDQDDVIRDSTYFVREFFVAKAQISFRITRSADIPSMYVPPTLRCGYFPFSATTVDNKKHYLACRFQEAQMEYFQLTYRDIEPSPGFKPGSITPTELYEFHRLGKHIHGFFLVWEVDNPFSTARNNRYLVDMFHHQFFPLDIEYTKWEHKLRVAFDLVTAYNLQLAEIVRMNRPVFDTLAQNRDSFFKPITLLEIVTLMQEQGINPKYYAYTCGHDRFYEWGRDRCNEDYLSAYFIIIGGTKLLTSNEDYDLEYARAHVLGNKTNVVIAKNGKSYNMDLPTSASEVLACLEKSEEPKELRVCFPTTNTTVTNLVTDTPLVTGANKIVMRKKLRRGILMTRAELIDFRRAAYNLPIPTPVKKTKKKPPRKKPGRKPVTKEERALKLHDYASNIYASDVESDYEGYLSESEDARGEYPKLKRSMSAESVFIESSYTDYFFDTLSALHSQHLNPPEKSLAKKRRRKMNRIVQKHTLRFGMLERESMAFAELIECYGGTLPRLTEEVKKTRYAIRHNAHLKKNIPRVFRYEDARRVDIIADTLKSMVTQIVAEEHFTVRTTDYLTRSVQDARVASQQVLDELREAKLTDLPQLSCLAMDFLCQKRIHGLPALDAEKLELENEMSTMYEEFAKLTPEEQQNRMEAEKHRRGFVELDEMYSFEEYREIRIDRTPIFVPYGKGSMQENCRKDEIRKLHRKLNDAIKQERDVDVIAELSKEIEKAEVELQQHQEANRLLLLKRERLNQCQQKRRAVGYARYENNEKAIWEEIEWEELDENDWQEAERGQERQLTDAEDEDDLQEAERDQEWQLDDAEEDEQQIEEQEAQVDRAEQQMEDNEALQKQLAEAEEKRKDDEARQKKQEEMDRKKKEDEERLKNLAEVEAELEKSRLAEEDRERKIAEAEQRRKEGDARKKRLAEAVAAAEVERREQQAKAEQQRTEKEARDKRLAEAEQHRKNTEVRRRQQVEMNRKEKEDKARLKNLAEAEQRRKDDEARQKRLAEEERQKNLAEAEQKRKEEAARRAAREESQKQQRKEEESRRKRQSEASQKKDSRRSQPPQEQRKTMEHVGMEFDQDPRSPLNVSRGSQRSTSIQRYPERTPSRITLDERVERVADWMSTSHRSEDPSVDWDPSIVNDANFEIDDDEIVELEVRRSETKERTPRSQPKTPRPPASEVSDTSARLDGLQESVLVKLTLEGSNFKPTSFRLVDQPPCNEFWEQLEKAETSEERINRVIQRGQIPRFIREQKAYRAAGAAWTVGLFAASSILLNGLSYTQMSVPSEEILIDDRDRDLRSALERLVDAAVMFDQAQESPQDMQRIVAHNGFRVALIPLIHMFKHLAALFVKLDLDRVFENDVKDERKMLKLFEVVRQKFEIVIPSICGVSKEDIWRLENEDEVVAKHCDQLRDTDKRYAARLQVITMWFRKIVTEHGNTVTEIRKEVFGEMRNRKMSVEASATNTAGSDLSPRPKAIPKGDTIRAKPVEDRRTPISRPGSDALLSSRLSLKEKTPVVPDVPLSPVDLSPRPEMVPESDTNRVNPVEGRRTPISKPGSDALLSSRRSLKEKTPVDRSITLTSPDVPLSHVDLSPEKVPESDTNREISSPAGSGPTLSPRRSDSKERTPIDRDVLTPSPEAPLSPVARVTTPVMTETEETAQELDALERKRMIENVSKCSEEFLSRLISSMETTISTLPCWNEDDSVRHPHVSDSPHLFSMAMRDTRSKEDSNQFVPVAKQPDTYKDKILSSFSHDILARDTFNELQWTVRRRDGSSKRAIEYFTDLKKYRDESTFEMHLPTGHLPIEFKIFSLSWFLGNFLPTKGENNGHHDYTKCPKLCAGCTSGDVILVHDCTCANHQDNNPDRFVYTEADLPRALQKIERLFGRFVCQHGPSSVLVLTPKSELPKEEHLVQESRHSVQNAKISLFHFPDIDRVPTPEVDQQHLTRQSEDPEFRRLLGNIVPLPWNQRWRSKSLDPREKVNSPPLFLKTSSLIDLQDLESYAHDKIDKESEKATKRNPSWTSERLRTRLFELNTNVSEVDHLQVIANIFKSSSVPHLNLDQESFATLTDTFDKNSLLRIQGGDAKDVPKFDDQGVLIEGKSISPVMDEYLSFMQYGKIQIAQARRTLAHRRARRADRFSPLHNVHQQIWSINVHLLEHLFHRISQATFTPVAIYGAERSDDMTQIRKVLDRVRKAMPTVVNSFLNDQPLKRQIFELEQLVNDKSIAPHMDQHVASLARHAIERIRVPRCASKLFEKHPWVNKECEFLETIDLLRVGILETRSASLDPQEFLECAEEKLYDKQEIISRSTNLDPGNVPATSSLYAAFWRQSYEFYSSLADLFPEQSMDRGMKTYYEYRSLLQLQNVLTRRTVLTSDDVKTMHEMDITMVYSALISNPPREPGLAEELQTLTETYNRLCAQLRTPKPLPIPPSYIGNTFVCLNSEIVVAMVCEKKMHLNEPKLRLKRQEFPGRQLRKKEIIVTVLLDTSNHQMHIAMRPISDPARDDRVHFEGPVLITPDEDPLDAFGRVVQPMLGKLYKQLKGERRPIGNTRLGRAEYPFAVKN